MTGVYEKKRLGHGGVQKEDHVRTLRGPSPSQGENSEKKATLLTP